MQTFRERRESLGLSREEMAVRCAVSAGTLANWESGRSLPTGSVGAILCYCRAYECSPDELLVMGNATAVQADEKDRFIP